jgi:hypothetical protein
LGSSWRKNVTDLGLGSLGAGLAARQLGTLHVIITNAPASEPPGAHVWVEEPGIPDFPYLIGSYLPVGGATTFPYGYPVAPDVPV